MEPEPTYSEDSAKRILARAVEIDHIRSASYSLQELRSIAAEVGVSEGALGQALRELQPVQTPVDPLRGQPLAPLHRRLLLPTATAGAIGVIGGLIDSATYFVSSPLAMGAMLMLGGVLAVSEDYGRIGRGLLRFQLRNAAAWGGAAAMWLLVTEVLGGAGPIATMVAMRIGIVGLALSALLGSLAAVVHVQLRRRDTHVDTDSGATATAPLKRRIAEKLKAWLDRWASRVVADDVTPHRGTHAPLAH